MLMWSAGAEGVVAPTADSFTVYIQPHERSGAKTPAKAEENGFRVQWIGVEDLSLAGAAVPTRLSGLEQVRAGVVAAPSWRPHPQVSAAVTLAALLREDLAAQGFSALKQAQVITCRLPAETHALCRVFGAANIYRSARFNAGTISCASLGLLSAPCPWCWNP